MSINFFHTISALTTIILVHLNNGSYTEDMASWTSDHIDMFKFTDVTASHVFGLGTTSLSVTIGKLFVLPVFDSKIGY